MVKIRFRFAAVLTGIVLLVAACSKKSGNNPTPNPTPTPVPVVITTENDPLLPGNPSGASRDTNARTDFFRETGYYSFSYHEARGIPNWVAWHLQSEDIGSAPRQDDFRVDAALPAGYYKVSPASYSSSGFDRGHGCPSADRTSTVAANSSTFLMTNMIPQAPNLNQGPWDGLESFIRTSLMGTTREAYIVSGSFGKGGYNSTGSFVNTLDANRVTVPAYVWKVVLSIPKGSNDLSRIDTSAILLAVAMPNDNRLYTTSGAGKNEWRNYIVTINDIEVAGRASGATLNFFSNLPANVRTYLRTKRYQ